MKRFQVLTTSDQVACVHLTVDCCGTRVLARVHSLVPRCEKAYFVGYLNVSETFFPRDFVRRPQGSAAARRPQGRAAASRLHVRVPLRIDTEQKS